MNLDEASYLVVDLEMTGLHIGTDVAIEIAAVKVKGKAVVDTFSSLLNPWTGTCPYKGILRAEITALTGISERELRLAPSAETVWQAFSAFAGNLPLVGHNIRTDYLFLRKGFKQELNLTYHVDTVDTLRWAKLLLGDVLTHHRLSALATYFAIPVVREHRALEDAMLTFTVFQKLKALKEDRYSSQEEFEAALQQKHKKVRAHRMKPGKPSHTLKQIWLGRNFVFSGIIPGLSRCQAMQYVLDLGGQVGEKVTRKTTDFVLGRQPENQVSQKQKKAQSLRVQTGTPRFWEESDFLAAVEKHYVRR